MVRTLCILLVLCGVMALLLATCDIGGSAPSPPENPIHMNDTNFVQASITIKKGERLTLIDDLEQLSESLLAVVQETMQPAHVSLWVRPTARDRQQEPTRISAPPVMVFGPKRL